MSEFYETYDAFDRKLLDQLQRNAGQSMDELAQNVGLSRNAVWRRMRRLEDSGIIAGRVALIDAVKVGLGLSVFIAIRAPQHDAAWAGQFKRVLATLPAIVGAYRTSGQQDYLLHAKVADVPGYDALYQALIGQIELADVSASFVMEAMKETNVLPL